MGQNWLDQFWVKPTHKCYVFGWICNIRIQVHRTTVYVYRMTVYVHRIVVSVYCMMCLHVLDPQTQYRAKITVFDTRTEKVTNCSELIGFFPEIT